jgi:hypothetical protein
MNFLINTDSHHSPYSSKTVDLGNPYQVSGSSGRDQKGTDGSTYHTLPHILVDMSQNKKRRPGIDFAETQTPFTNSPCPL